MYQTMPAPVNGNDVLKKLADCRESDEPEAILAIIKQHDGKPLTVRLLDKLPGGAERWHISKHAGMTYLAERCYTRTGGKEGVSYFLAYSETNVLISAKYIEEKNTCYFSARRERNAKRDRVLNGADKHSLANTMAMRINDVLRARMMLADAERGLDELTAHGEMFSPDEYTWEALAGAEKSR